MNRSDYVLLFTDPNTDRIYCHVCYIKDCNKLHKTEQEEHIITNCPITEDGSIWCTKVHPHQSDFNFNNTKHIIIATIDKCNASSLRLCTRECHKCYWTLIHNRLGKGLHDETT